MGNTDSRYAAIGDEYLFQHGVLRLCLHVECFTRLQAISNNPMICQRITTLEVDGDYTGLQSWLACPLWPLCPMYIRRGYRLYSQAYFQGCIRKLANLKSIKLRASTVVQLGILDQQFIYMLLEQITFLHYDIQVSVGMEVQLLKSDNLYWTNPCCRDLDMFRRSGSIQRTLLAADRLTCLDVSLRVIDKLSTKMQMDQLMEFLESTPNVEDLRLNFGSLDRHKIARGTDFGRIWSLEFKHLRLVEFSYGKVAYADLLDFLLSQPVTLKEIRLGDLRLRSGRWDTFINTMSVSQLVLEKFLLFGRLSDTLLRANEMWLCGAHTTPMAEEVVVNPQGALLIYPRDMQGSVRRAQSLDSEIRARRAFAGLPCDRCATCRMLKAPT